MSLRGRAIILGVVAGSVVWFGSAVRTLGQDPAKVSPEVYRVLFENDRVRVLEMRLNPSQKDQMHSHPSELVYFFEAGKVHLDLPGGKGADKEIRPGEVMFHEGWTHRVENQGSSQVHAIIVELKT